jgi:uncharacterized membrane protein YeaQ/YmgE (transglycosylase-associated protein family)
MTMTLTSLVILLVIACICGAIGQTLVGSSRGGLVTSVALGFVGAFLGAWIADRFNLPELFVLDVAGQAFPIVWSIIGAALLVVLIGLVTRRRSRGRIFA